MEQKNLIFSIHLRILEGLRGDPTRGIQASTKLKQEWFQHIRMTCMHFVSVQPENCIGREGKAIIAKYLYLTTKRPQSKKSANASHICSALQLIHHQFNPLA